MLIEEEMAMNADRIGQIFREQMRTGTPRLVELVRGKGLMNALVIRKTAPVSAWDVCLALRDNGLLAKPTHESIIRLAPPLCISRSEIDQCIAIIKDTLASLDK